MMPGRMKNRSGRASALLSLFPTCKRCSDKAGRAAVRPYRLATFDLDEKNASGTKLKDGTQSCGAAATRGPIQIIVLSDYQGSDGICSVIGHTSVTKIMDDGICP